MAAHCCWKLIFIFLFNCPYKILFIFIFFLFFYYPTCLKLTTLNKLTNSQLSQTLTSELSPLCLTAVVWTQTSMSPAHWSSIIQNSVSLHFNKDLLFVTREPLEDSLILLVEDSTNKDPQLLGHIVILVSAIEKQLDEHHVASSSIFIFIFIADLHLRGSVVVWLCWWWFVWWFLANLDFW